MIGSDDDLAEETIRVLARAEAQAPGIRRAAIEWLEEHLNNGWQQIGGTEMVAQWFERAGHPVPEGIAQLRAAEVQP